jgi:hypothetical protein
MMITHLFVGCLLLISLLLGLLFKKETLSNAVAILAFIVYVGAGIGERNASMILFGLAMTVSFFIGIVIRHRKSRVQA